MLIYCGAVIFVTKPESFAFSAIFGDVDNVVTVPTSEQREAQAKADREAISAEILTVSAQKADMAEKQAVAAAEKQTDQAIRTAMQTYETGLQQMISDAVAEAYANAADISEEVEAAIPGIVDQVTKNIEAGIDYYIPQILDAVIPEVLTHEGELADMLYEKYGQTLVDIVYEKVSEMFEAQMVEEEPVPMSQQEYEEARQAVRDAEINGLLSQLQD
ncbi:MAG: hypothetical protein MJ057_00595 [Sphaerochaetaceae bacterium]|nr:hypothetical protein [Sphaerochaetaceae bacterium]